MTSKIRTRKPSPAGAAPLKPAPLKRPRQARAKVTVQAIYDAFVRIWQRDGWAGVTTRAVALETGISVGAFYDWFPNKEALLSGYVRHAFEAMLAQVAAQAAAPEGLADRERLRRLVRLCSGVDVSELPPFDAGMLALEDLIAEPRLHRRFHDELCAAWRAVLARCTTLPPQALDRVDTLAPLVWGGRRYRLLVAPGYPDDARWLADLQALCGAALGLGPAPPG